MRGLLGAAGLALFATACTAIVAGELKKYDSFKVTDTPTTSGSSGSGGSDPCALTYPDAGNACSACIATNCAANVALACPADGGTPAPWFRYMTECAQNPVNGFDYACGTYDKPDSGPINSSPDDPAKQERDALLCVRDNCLYNSPTPPCDQCVVTVTKPGSTGGSAKLEDTDCGQCIRDQCGPLLVKCCSNLPAGLEACGYTAESEYATNCANAVHRDAGGPDAKPSPGSPSLCDWEFGQGCLAACASRCPQP